MISNPNFIFYTCVATGTTILAEFNSRDADLAALALKCLEKTPNHHISFTHTVHNRSYTFLIDSPFVYFAIYDKKLEYPEALSHLKSVRDAFVIIHLNSDAYQSHNLRPHCFQGEFYSVFHQLLSSNVNFKTLFLPREVLEVPKSENFGLERGGKGFGSMQLSGGTVSPRSLLKKKGKRFGNGDGNQAIFENKVDFSDRDLSMSILRNRGLYENSSAGGSYKAKKIWKRQVWVVLTMDLVLCLVLFGVWLRVCRGFKCIDI